jgi:hypothetical protein
MKAARPGRPFRFASVAAAATAQRQLTLGAWPDHSKSGSFWPTLADPAQGAMIALEGAGQKIRRRRMRWLALFLPLLAALALGGCATDVEPSAAELQAHWEAQNVYPQGYKSDLLAFLRTYLNDPTHVRGAAVSLPQRKTVGPGERYVACVRYNARDSDGKYMGSKDGAAVYVSGKLDRFIDVPKVVRELCKDAGYAPFPELAKLTR